MKVQISRILKEINIYKSSRKKEMNKNRRMQTQCMLKHRAVPKTKHFTEIDVPSKNATLTLSS